MSVQGSVFELFGPRCCILSLNSAIEVPKKEPRTFNGGSRAFGLWPNKRTA